MIIQGVLERQIVGGLQGAELPHRPRVELWDGAWDALASPTRHSFPKAAALVSLTGLALVHRGQQAFEPKQLAAERTLRRVRAAHGGGHQPLPAETPPQPTPQVRIDVAVTFVSGAPAADLRALEVLEMAEAAVPVLIKAALEDIRGTNLYAKALYEAGMSAFALLGGRLVELAPGHPEASPPAEVCVVSGPGSPARRVWPDG